MAARQIRVIALAVVRDGDRIVVFEAFDDVKRETFYRQLGGGVEFGETGREAVARELDEELGTRLEAVSYVATLQNIFVYEGEPGHEIALIHAARLSDRALYERDAWEMVDEGERQRMLWKRIDDFGAGARLYPDGLLDLIA